MEIQQDVIKSETALVDVDGVERQEAERWRVTLWEVISMLLVLLVSLFLNFYHLGQDGYGNLYYAATIKSMSENWHTFFFASFDPAGFISVDKPPISFWLQVGSAKLFGFSPWSLLFPQALAGMLSVVLLGYLLRRRFGPVAGLLAAATLAVTPVSIVTNRNITMDSLLTLVLLLAAWAAMVAAEKGSLRLLLVSAALIGIGFNIKMLEAYLVVPAFALLYWFTAPYPTRKRFWHLVCAAVVMVVVSFWWIMAVDLTPATQRPFVGSSGTNSELQLALFYNGVMRYAGNIQNIVTAHAKATQAIAKTLPAFVLNNASVGNSGLLRLVSPPLGGQIGLLLPLSVLGLIGIRWDKPSLWPLNRQQQGLALWGIWFLVQFTFFCAAAFYHPHYLVVIAPAQSALLAMGIVTIWRDSRSRYRRWFLPVVLLLTIAVQMVSLQPYFSLWGALLMPVLCVGVVASLLLCWYIRPVYRRVMLGLVLCLVLIMPSIWSVVPVLEDRNDVFPYGGPDISLTQSARDNQLETLAMQVDAEAQPDAQLIAYLVQQQGRARYLAATPDSTLAAPIIVATGRPAIALGGYSGSDHVVTVAQFAHLTTSGSVRFVLLPLSRQEEAARIDPAIISLQENVEALTVLGQADGASEADWVRSHCSVVPVSQWHHNAQSAAPLLDVYDCSNAAP